MASLPGQEEKFHDELRWCITQLELGLQRQDPDSRQAQETVKILKILRSPKAPLVKKRQAMRSALGDYRKKMKESEKKFLSGLRNSRFQTGGNTKAHSKSKFLKQSHSRTVDRDGLGSHLSNLHLQEGGDISPSPGMGYQVAGSDLGAHAGGDASGYVLSENSAGGTSNFSHAPFSHQASSSSSNPASQGVFSEELDNSVRSKFHFVPSDNSFCFGFSNNENDIEKDDGTTGGRGGSGLTPEGDTNSLSEVKSEREKQTTLNAQVKSTVFHYERTDNSFVFDFS